MIDFSPGLVLIAAAALIALFPRRGRVPIAVAAPLLTLLCVWGVPEGTGPTLQFLGQTLDPVHGSAVGRLFATIFAIAAFGGALFGIHCARPVEYVAAFIYAGSAIGVTFAGDWITLLIFWELMAVASTGVIWAGGTERAWRASLRYLYIHLLGGVILMFGIAGHVLQTGTVEVEPVALTSPAAWMMLIGVVINAGAPPLWSWVADAYPEASPSGSVFLSAFTTKTAVFVLLIAFPGAQVLIPLGLVMVAYGAIYALLADDMRRLLSYSIVGQVGFMVVCIGVGTELALDAAAAHAFAHILYKGLLLMGAGAVIYATGRSKMSELGGIANRQRLLLALYMIGAVSISSVPLFSGYVSKELAVEAAYLDHRTLVVLLLKVASVGTFLHTGLKLPYGTWFGREGAGPRTNAGHRIQVGPVPVSMYVAMAISSLLNLAIGVYPDLLYDLLPYAVEYEPYTIPHVLDKVQLLLFTALGSWILLGKLGAEPTVSIDTDWFYRRLPRLVATRAPALVPGTAHRAAAATTSTLRTARTRVLAQLDQAPYGQPPAVPPTWGLGAVVLLVGGLLLLINLVSP